ncbi:MAG TPA: DUF1592 domain-containing protein, partial [Bryobacteraceae bacterium]|nr:DUF1592 domain-containing protein [Bryobacteraceae bacterium]
MAIGLRATRAACATLLLVGFSPVHAQQTAAAAPAQSAFGHSVQPVLAKHCFSCHNEKVAMAKLDLASFRDHEHATTQPQVWEKVGDKLRTRKMPPPGQPSLTDVELQAVTRWIEQIAKPPAQTASAPGRVLPRRLNRIEYSNTVRDLLGVQVNVASDFPVDDSGYGFDNIGDVLTLSPMLMEKYLAAAQRISRVAVFGEPVPPKPTRLARLLGRRSHDATDVASGSGYAEYLPYSIRGALYGHWTFPVDAEYEFRVRIANFRANVGGPGSRGEEAARLAAPPRKLLLTLDGAPVLADVVEGSTSFGYARGEFTARLQVKAGEHFLRASYPELADLEDPRQNINPDKRRALFVDYVEIIGPFNPSKQPPQSYNRIFVCGHTPGTHQTACGRTVLSALLTKAYRRPPSDAEVQSKLQLLELAHKEGDSFEEGVRLALEATLVSPNFLLRGERPPAAAGPSERLNDYELASRLSYFLWSSMPDQELFRAANDSSLRRPEVLAAQVRRMLADKRALNLIDNFGAQWLQLRNLGRTKPDPARFPTVDDELLEAMKRETSLFMEAVMREDRSVLDFIDGPFTFLNGPLARHYG